MSAMAWLVVIAFLAFARLAGAAECACDPQSTGSLEVRQCSLCREAEKQPADVAVFFLKDISPRKPNRWLALPRRHLDGGHHLHEMPSEERTQLWTAAIQKAREIWGDAWGLAYNGSKVRTQCHTHIHIGKLLTAAELPNFIVVSHPSQIPAPDHEGVWVHPVGNKFHVHVGEQTTETVLLK
jgi:hypothetical protein